MKTKDKYLLVTLLNGLVSALISALLTFIYLEKSKPACYFTFIIAFWIFFNLQKILLEEMLITSSKD